MIEYRVYIHVHHMGSLIERHPYTYFTERITEFETEKSKEEVEWKIALRKKLFADVTDILPPPLAKARIEVEEARAKWIEINDTREWIEANAKWDNAILDYGLDRLHAELCLSRVPDCPWDGKRIFINWIFIVSK